MKYGGLIFFVMVATLSAGCNDTARGVGKDAEDNAKATGQAVEQTGEAIQKAGEKSAEATAGALDAAKLTPQIKTAILANPMLKEPGNEINVDTTNDTVYLKGHVKTEEMKRDAEEIAKKILQENSATHKLVNELEVR